MTTTPTAAQVEADIARNRAELAEVVDELSDRLNPRNQANHIVEEAKLAVADLKRKVTGEVRPADEPEPTKAGWVALGAGAAVAIALVTGIIRKL